MSDTSPQSNPDEKNKPGKIEPKKKAAKKKAAKKKAAKKKAAGSSHRPISPSKTIVDLYDLPPIPEEAKKNTDEKTEVLELVPVLEDDPMPVTKALHQYTIIGGDGDEYGPKPIEDVLRWIRTGRANARTLVRTGKDSHWKPLGQLPELSMLLEGGELPPRRPGQVTAIAALTLAGGLIALAWTILVAWIGIASVVFVCCFIPSGLYSLISGILITIHGIKLLGRNAGAHLPRTSIYATLQIFGVFAFNPICLILGIITHVLLRSDEVAAYIKGTTPNPKV
tara:strand:- start:742 stop:1584 length:843 start_codon:yes stop_codon:yes gene_type:complete